MTRQQHKKWERIPFSVLLFMITTSIHVWAAADPTPPRHPLGGTSTRPNDMTRRIQTWMINHKAIPKTRSLRQPTRRAVVATTQGSLLTLQKPTKANICRWFGIDEDPGNLRCMLRRQFNHDSVGMTHPTIHVYSDEQSRQTLVLCTSTTSSKSLIHNVVATSARSETKCETNWWPSLSFAPTQSTKWRVLTFRKKVGNGLECYQRVRDAALDWEFHATDDMGLALVPSPSMINPVSNRLQRPALKSRYTVAPVQIQEKLEHNDLPLHQCIGAARRLVSYSAKRMAPFLPKIYSVNPVMVVYDVVDQRGPATTFTSTAYATMKGHLLRGEERVTVALRDGTDDVEVEILSVSRAGRSAKARAIWPFIGKMQKKFFESQVEFLYSIGSETMQKGEVMHNHRPHRRIH